MNAMLSLVIFCYSIKLYAQVVHKMQLQPYLLFYYAQYVS